jgi:hypothetical protein
LFCRRRIRVLADLRLRVVRRLFLRRPPLLQPPRASPSRRQPPGVVEPAPRLSVVADVPVCCDAAARPS